MSCLMTKPTKWSVRPVKTQISLGVRPVWSASSLSAWKKHGKDWLDWVDAQADLSLCWAHMPDCWFCCDAALLCLLNVKQSPYTDVSNVCADKNHKTGCKILICILIFNLKCASTMKEKHQDIKFMQRIRVHACFKRIVRVALTSEPTHEKRDLIILQ